VLGFRPRPDVDYYRGGWAGDGASLDAAIALGMGCVTVHGEIVMATPACSRASGHPDSAAQLMARDASDLGRALTTCYRRQRAEVGHA
jgi:hypothetical protein